MTPSGNILIDFTKWVFKMAAAARKGRPRTSSCCGGGSFPKHRREIGGMGNKKPRGAGLQGLHTRVPAIGPLKAADLGPSRLRPSLLPPQLGRAPLRLGQHGAGPSRWGFDSNANFGRAD
jgi:hypothetical protein